MIDIPAYKKESEAERGIIACLMRAGRDAEDAQLDLIFDGLNADDFFTPELREIFKHAKALRDERQPVDPQIISRRCKFDNPAGYIMCVLGEFISAALAGSYIKLVLEAARQRTVVETATDALKMAQRSHDPEMAVDALRAGLESLKETDRTTQVTTAAQATDSYMRFLSLSDRTMPRSAIKELDAALGGGVDFGEMIVLAARPSHGKTAIALQCAHNWTADGLPVLYVSLEMSAAALGKRIMQFSSDVPEEYWRSDINDVRSDVEAYHSERANFFIVDALKTLDTIVREIERSVRQRGVKAVVIDYAQLIQSPGKSRYEQITHTSTVLRGVASEHRLLMLVLCQMSREIEARKKFIPVMSDIKESGQFEQDADVVLFVVWPHRIDSSQPAHEYQFFIAKNRNRPILNSAFTARFEPSRQRVVSPTVRDMPNYEPCFEDHDPFAN